MRAVWIIAKRELDSFFDSLIAYILLTLFLGLSGFFTWVAGDDDIFLVGQTTLSTFYGIAYWTLFIFIPAITMRMIAEEKKTGTIELLLTKAVTDRQVILGKFLGSIGLVLIALLFTLPYVISLANIGNLDFGEVVCGYFALLLLSASYVSIGIFASSVTNNQIVAFLIAILLEICFNFIFSVLSNSTTGILSQLLDSISIRNHYFSITRGIIDSRDLIYFASVIGIGLLLSELSLTKRNIA